MKNLVYIIFGVIFSCSIVYAQTGSGNYLFGASSTLSIGQSKEKQIQNNTSNVMGSSVLFNINPQAGYFIIDNVAAGILLSYNLIKNYDADDNKLESTSLFSLGPFGRYYFDFGKIKPFAEAAIFIGNERVKDFQPTKNTEKSSLFGFQFNAAIAYFISENVSANLIAGYRFRNFNEANDVKQRYKDFGLQVGFDIFL